MELLIWSRQDAKLHLIGLVIQDKHVNIAEALQIRQYPPLYNIF